MIDGSLARICVLVGLVLLPALAAHGQKRPDPATFGAFPMDDRLIGVWTKVGSGHRIDIKPNGDVHLLFGAEATRFNGMGAIERCTDGGGNLCISGPGTTRCSYRYSFYEGGMNLQYRGGGPDGACVAASGDFRRVQE